MCYITNITAEIDNSGRCLSFKPPKSLIHIDNVFNAWTYGLLTVMRGVGGGGLRYNIKTYDGQGPAM